MDTTIEKNNQTGLSYNSGYGYKQEAYDHAEVWVADFGPDGLEQELKAEMAKIKTPKLRRTSWIFSSIVVLVVLVVVEMLWHSLASQYFWSDKYLLSIVWLSRLALLIIWLQIANNKLYLDSFKLFTTTVISFGLSVVISAFIKVFSVGATWTLINVLVEPIWMILLIAVVGIIYQKIFNKNNQNKDGRT